MIKGLIKLALFLFVGFVAYNYFFGTPEEKEKSKEIIGKAVDVGKAGVGLVKEEIGKFKSGKYDGALDKIGDAIKKAKSKVQDGGDMLKRMNEWEAKKEKWLNKRDQLDEGIKSGSISEEQAAKNIQKLEAEFEQLKKEGEALGVD